MTPYTTTYTGRQIAPDNEQYPSLLDIAIGLSRIVRFAGQGREFYTVLSHTLFMDDLYKQEFGNVVLPEVRLAILLHDASEAIGSDVPSPMKTVDYKKVQHDLDCRIFDAYYHRFGGYEAYCDREDEPYKTVKMLDWRALLAEYWRVGPAQPCYLDQPTDADREFFLEWQSQNFHIDGERFNRCVDPAGRYGVREYLNRVIRLL